MLSAQQCQSIVAHMNQDHADAILLYAKAFGGLPQAHAASMADIDATGMDLEVTCGNKTTRVRIPFEKPLRNPNAARQTLINMAVTARRLCVKAAL